MKKVLALLGVMVLMICSTSAVERETIWPKGKMPHPQEGQIAAMTDEVAREGFNPKKNRVAYLEWYDAPSADVRNGACMILISGGGYYSCCDVDLVEFWHKELTAQGYQCVKFVYRTPRPEGLPIYQSAWEDGQRAVRMV